ncbi:phosphoenolpyruvate--protein phosphotransferase [Oceaniferula spumae]|uniref:Phosphoenolpyruvate-protein phosphotransferase n=1 Tax=Oceaniferula spumae TaxID=2979115 RepID=A0AAT9FKN9_9BACT
MSESSTSAPTELHGIGVAPGAAMGTAFVLSAADRQAPDRDITDEEIPNEVLRLQEALLITRNQISDIQKQMTEAIGAEEAGIFDAHLMMAEDHSFIEKILKGLNERKKNVEAIVREVADDYANAFLGIDDDYVRERVADLRDVTRRILRNLDSPEEADPSTMAEGSIVLAQDLSPSETATLDRTKVIAFATDQGSQTSHTAITARSLEIPAVVGLGEVTSRVKHGDPVLIDGTQGVVIANPTQEQLVHYGHLTEARKEITDRLREFEDRSAETSDEKEIWLGANIQSPSDVSAVKEHGARGVGLFRTEYMFLSRSDLPDEEEQTAAYEETVRALSPDPVVIRTLDIGGDKIATSIKTRPETNPFLGCRGIRFSLAQPDIFLTQLRAILRASVAGNVRIMFPMISNVGEVLETIALLDRAKDELRNEGHDFNPDIEVGVMIEVPAAALGARLIAPHVDFFSIGTNDLIQYAFAVDRLNDKVAPLYTPTHPVILDLIAKTVAAARAHKRHVSVCGQMASNPILAPLLVGLGVDGLSVSPPSASLVKRALIGVKQSECTALAESALHTESADEALNLCRELCLATAPEIIELLG